MSYSKIPARMKRALFKKFTGISRMLLKRRIRIMEIPRSEGQIGYTSEDNIIHLSVDNPFLDDLPLGEKVKFVRGIWVHETMHQILTDFNAMKVLFKDDIICSMIYRDVYNIVEDARIENFAPKYIGGIYTEDRYDRSGHITQLSDLSFSKREMYKKSPGIDTPDAFGDYPSPLQQVMRAMIHYGDCGLIKGKFISDEAFELFNKILPIYNECVEEKNCRKVIAKSIEIAEILRPLWENNKVIVIAVTNEINSLKGGDHSKEGNVIIVAIAESDSDDENISSVNRKATSRKLGHSSTKSSEGEKSEDNSGDTVNSENDDASGISEEKQESESKTETYSSAPVSDEKSEAAKKSESQTESEQADNSEGDTSDESAERTQSTEDGSGADNSEEETTTGGVEVMPSDENGNSECAGNSGSDSETESDSIGAEESGDDTSSGGADDSPDNCENSLGEGNKEVFSDNDTNSSNDSENPAAADNKPVQMTADSESDANGEGNSDQSNAESCDNEMNTNESEDFADIDTSPESADMPSGATANENITADESSSSEEGLSDEEDSNISNNGELVHSSEKPLYNEDVDEEPDYDGDGIELDDIEDYSVPEDELESIVDELEELIHKSEKEELQLDDTSIPPDLDFKCGEFTNVSVLNRNVTVISEDAETTETAEDGNKISVYSSYDIYDEIVSGLRPHIKTGIKSFQRLFRNDPDEKCHKTSGKLNIERRYSGRITSRMFDKAVVRHKATDFAVFLLVDESGSMCCEDRYKYARMAAVGLSEMFEKLQIPLYVMGFTADEEVNDIEYDVVHHHYIKWNNNRKTRLALLSISNYYDNFDGYSLRYAYHLLKKRKEPNKILIVVSDGVPSSDRCCGDAGIADARMAVNEARKHLTVLGVSIGGSYISDSLRQIYGNGLLIVNDLSELFMNISSKLRKQEI